MRKNLYFLLFVSILFFVQSCGENNEIGKTEFYWDQTGCADPWEVNNQISDEELKLAIISYLKSKGVKQAKVTRITNEAQQQVCFACFCTTGRRIFVEVPLVNKSRMLALGFQEFN
jgi:hypothetical protein